MDNTPLNREQSSAIAEALLVPERAAQQTRSQAVSQREAARLAWRQKVRRRGGFAIAGLLVGGLLAWVLGNSVQGGAVLGALMGLLCGALPGIRRQRRQPG